MEKHVSVSVHRVSFSDRPPASTHVLDFRPQTVKQKNNCDYFQCQVMICNEDKHLKLTPDTQQNTSFTLLMVNLTQLRHSLWVTSNKKPKLNINRVFGRVCTWVAATFQGVVAVGHRRGAAGRRRGSIATWERHRQWNMLKIKTQDKELIKKTDEPGSKGRAE